MGLTDRHGIIAAFISSKFVYYLYTWRLITAAIAFLNWRTRNSTITTEYTAIA